MTTKELSNQFDIYYNGIATNSAPPIDLYEKSVYLTDAQLEIVNNYFNPLGNKYQKGFEGNSKRRNDLEELVRNHKSTIKVPSNDGISPNSVFFRIPNDTYLIVQEKVLVGPGFNCETNKYLDVVPKTHDEFNIQEDNPFKKPDKTVAWRMNYFSQSSNFKNVEIIAPFNIIEYKYRYVKYPQPIILTDLATAFPSEGLTINGLSNEQTCMLSKSTCIEILKRAVEMATADYKPNDLPVKTQMNFRNE